MKNHFAGTGRRKSSVARAILKKGTGIFIVNKKDYKDYFLKKWEFMKFNQPLEVTGNENKYDIKINVKGSGLNAQVEACRLAISRALVKADPENRLSLKKNKLLTRDARVCERKKYGQKGARRAFQFSKR